MVSRLYETYVCLDLVLKSQPMKRELHVCKTKNPKPFSEWSALLPQKKAKVKFFWGKSAIIRYCAYLFFVVCISLQNVHVDG